MNAKCRQKDDVEGDAWPYRSWAFITFKSSTGQQAVMAHRKLAFFGTKVAPLLAPLSARTSLSLSVMGETASADSD